MALYKIAWKSSASKELRSLPKHVIAEIVSRVGILGEDPFPSSVKKLAGAEHTIVFALEHIGLSIPYQKRIQ